MIHLFKTCMITAFILGLTWSAPLRAQDQRYISIRNTDTIWLPGNICAYQFRLDNGGNDEGFGPLTISKRAARTVLTGMCYSVGSATRQGSSSPTRFIGQSAMTSRT